MAQSYLETKGRIFNIQRFSIHDGPGVRTIVFLKGCPLRCRWCCNPESQEWHFENMLQGGITKQVGRDVTVAEVLEEISRDRVYYRRSGFGGMTLSGGECLWQPEFSEALLRGAKELGISTSIDLVSENSDRYSLVIPCLKYTDYLIVNEIEASNIAGFEPLDENLKEIAEKLMSLGVREKVIIHKSDRAVALSNDGFTTLPALDIPSEKIKGTTGAGDAFCAGALLAICDGKSDREILDFASSVALVSLFSKDATSGIVCEEKVKEISKEYGRKKYVS